MSGSDEPTLPLTTPPPSRTYHPLTAELDPPSKRMSILDLTVEIPSSTRVHSSLTDAKRPVRWKTLEFKLYYALAVIMLPIMAWIPISISRGMFLLFALLVLMTYRCSQHHILTFPSSSRDCQKDGSGDVRL